MPKNEQFHYNTEIIEAIHQFLEKVGLNCEFDPQSGVFSGHIPLQSAIGQASLLITVKSDYFSSMLFSSCRADPKDQKTMYELMRFVNFVNDSFMNYGSFELDEESGSVAFRQTIDCADITPSEKMIANSIIVGAITIDQCAREILGLTSGFLNYEEAVLSIRERRKSSQKKGADSDEVMDDPDDAMEDPDDVQGDSDETADDPGGSLMDRAALEKLIRSALGMAEDPDSQNDSDSPDGSGESDDSGLPSGA